MQRLRAFTLVELLISIAIIGILSSVVLANLQSSRSKARDAQRLAAIKQIQTALEVYKVKNGSYPQTSSDVSIRNNSCGNFTCGTTGCGYAVGDWATTLAPLVTSRLLPSIPNDPRNTGQFCYTYFNNSTAISGNNDWADCGPNGNINISEYQYVIYGTFENALANFPVINWNSIDGSNNYSRPGAPKSEERTYCFLGPSKQ
jgi:prepilin-type N-terminal cleavage/methylation domain-containing protein